MRETFEDDFTSKGLRSYDISRKSSAVKPSHSVAWLSTSHKLIKQRVFRKNNAVTKPYTTSQIETLTSVTGDKRFSPMEMKIVTHGNMTKRFIKVKSID